MDQAMSLVLTEDQNMLARTAASFMAESSPVARLRKLRDARDERGYSRDVYRKMAELGWTAIPFAESDGGLGMGLAEIVLVTEAMGRTLAPEPLIPSLMLAGQVLARAGSAAQKQAWLRPAIAGEKVLACAYAEQGSRFDLAAVTTRAERVPGGYTLSGQKPHVWGGHLADAYVVSARVSGAPGERAGIALFLVPAAIQGVSSTRQSRVDSLNAGILRLDGVRVGDSDLIGAASDGYALLADAVDCATVALCGEMLGGMSEAFDRTLAYLKERKQFGVPIGSFQALKHRAARMYIELELTRSATMAAARAIDAAGADASTLVSVAKARASDAYCQTANEAVQMHGGIGMTDEHEIGFFLKRARACEMTFGDAAFHRDRFASLGGF
jgi:alkylation response protein AidB-like acyl-CoA dehydrogenase